jgi:hypothetical protein
VARTAIASGVEGATYNTVNLAVMDAADAATGARHQASSLEEYLATAAFGGGLGSSFGAATAALTGGVASRYLPSGQQTRAQRLAIVYPQLAPVFDQLAGVGHGASVEIRILQQQIDLLVERGLIDPTSANKLRAIGGDARAVVRVAAPLNQPVVPQDALAFEVRTAYRESAAVDSALHERVPTPDEAETHRAMAREAIEFNEQRTQEATALLESIDAPKVHRLVIGQGTAATLSHSTHARAAAPGPGPLKELPDLLAISDQKDWWQILGDRDIGQPVRDWRSRGYRWQPGAFNSDHEGLGRASDLAYANAMTAMESGMVTARGRITEVEQYSEGAKWPVAAKWRGLYEGRKWVYADEMVVAGGLGLPRPVNAIAKNPAVEHVLTSTKRMTFAQERLVPNVAEGATVVVVGDGGSAGWAAQEAVRTGRQAIIVARSSALPGVPAHVQSDLAAHHVEIVQGEIKTATLEGETLVLGVAESADTPVTRHVRADGVSVAIGQVQALPRGMENLHFRMIKRTVAGKERVVGLEAYDPVTKAPTGLVVHGAEMATPPFKKGPTPYVENREEFVAALTRQANDEDVPPLSRGVEPSIHQSAVNVPLANEGSR